MSDPFQHAFSLETERAVLSVIFDGRHVESSVLLMETCPQLECFYVPKHQLIVRTIFLMAQGGKRIDSLAIMEAMKQLRFLDVMEKGRAVAWRFDEGLDARDSLFAHVGFELLMAIGEAFGPVAGFRENCKLLAGYHRQRQLIRALTSHIEAATGTDGRTKAEAIGDQIINDVSTALGGSAATVTMDDAMGSALRMHDAAQRQGAARVAVWGLPTLDRVLPLRAGRVYVLAANTGCGKTSLALQAAVATARQLGTGSVAIINREQPPEELARILICRDIGVSLRAIEAGYLTKPQREAADVATAKWAGTDLAIKSTAGSCTVPEMVSWIRQRYLRTGGKLALVVFDYIQLLSPTSHRDTEYSVITRGTRALKELAMELRIAVLVISQFGREGKKSPRGRDGRLGPELEPRKEDLKGSSSIENDTDAVALIWSRAEVETPQLVVEIKIDKNRMGPKGTVQALFDKPAGQIFREMLLPNQPTTDPADSSRKHHAHPPIASEDRFAKAEAAQAAAEEELDSKF